jgi:hypothetical protein
MRQQFWDGMISKYGDEGHLKARTPCILHCVAACLDQSCAWEARRLDRIGRDGFGLSTITTNSTRPHLSLADWHERHGATGRSPPGAEARLWQ